MDVPSQDSPPGPIGGSRRLTRRQVLGGLGAAVLAGVGLAVVGIDRLLRPTPVPASPAPTSLAASAGPSQGASPSPAASGVPAGPRRAFRSRPDLTPPLITVTPGSAPDASEGLIFLTPGNGAGVDGPLIVDVAGEPVWIGPDSKQTVVGLTVVSLGGAPALCWWEGDNNNGIGSGEYVFADAAYREIRRLAGAGGAKADLHELLLTSTGTALLFVAEPRTTDRATGTALRWPIMDCVVQEIDLASGALQFEWHTADHIEVEESYADPPTKADAVYDYIHANAIDVDSDGHLLVSARNTSTIYKVHRRTGDVIWRMGGKRSDFTIEADAVFGWQHDVRRRADGTLTIFDNAHAAADDTSGHPSRAIVIAADEGTMTARLVREYPHPTPLIASSQGNVQLLASGELFVGWGSTPWFTQFTAAGETVLDATFPAAKQSYRSLRFPWSGRPAEPPVLAIDRQSSDSVTVHASWNGHTDVASWEVLAGPTATGLHVVATAVRTGFETTVDATTTEPLIAVRALDASGAVLGTAVPMANPG